MTQHCIKLLLKNFFKLFHLKVLKDLVTADKLTRFTFRRNVNARYYFRGRHLVYMEPVVSFSFSFIQVVQVIPLVNFHGGDGDVGFGNESSDVYGCFLHNLIVTGSFNVVDNIHNTNFGIRDDI